MSSYQRWSIFFGLNTIWLRVHSAIRVAVRWFVSMCTLCGFDTEHQKRQIDANRREWFAFRWSQTELKWMWMRIVHFIHSADTDVLVQCSTIRRAINISGDRLHTTYASHRHTHHRTIVLETAAPSLATTRLHTVNVYTNRYKIAIL